MPQAFKAGRLARLRNSFKLMRAADPKAERDMQQLAKFGTRLLLPRTFACRKPSAIGLTSQGGL
jgi:hypothetical protein